MRRVFMILAVLFSLTLSSCGGGGPTTTIDVTLGDFQFTPNQFSVPAGQEITLNARNNGAVVHDFVIMKLGTTAGTGFDDEDVPNIYWEVELQPGGSTTATFIAPTDPGDYQVVCRTEGHLEAGMVGKLTVVAGEQ